MIPSILTSGLPHPWAFLLDFTGNAQSRSTMHVQVSEVVFELSLLESGPTDQGARLCSKADGLLVVLLRRACIHHFVACGLPRFSSSWL